MAVVIRLQGLPVVAGSVDIRRFFSGLNIPDGGVHIIGGEKGEAFIIFATDEDARLAMTFSGGYIKDSRIEFFLSSKTEMQNVIELNRKKCDRSGRETAGSRWTGSNNSGVGGFSNSVVDINKGIGRSNYDSVDLLEDRFHSNGSRNSNTDLSKSSYNQPRKESFRSDNMYLYIRGMPYSATEDDVITFFAGLQVDGVIMFKVNGRNSGAALVKFATPNDARKGLQRDRNFMGERYIEVRWSSEGKWIQNGGIEGKMGRPFSDEQIAHDLSKESFYSSTEHIRRDPDYLSSRRYTHSRSPPRRVVEHGHSRSPPRRMMTRAHSVSPPRKVVPHTSSRSPPRRVMAQTRSRSPPRRVMEHAHSRSPPRRIMAHSHSRSPPRRVTARSRSPFSGSVHSHSPQTKEYYIHVKNVPLEAEKRDLRAFFEELDVPNSQIIFFKTHGNKTNKDVVVMFTSMRDYCAALGYHKNYLYGRQILLFPITKTAVLQLAGFSETRRSPERHHHVKEKSDRDGYSGSNTCVYVRNFPYDVTKAEVQKFFADFNIYNSDIHLLYDEKGIGLGEALVKFRTEDEAQKAESLNRRHFLGTEVLLRCISEKQMQEFGINVSSVSDEKMQDHLHTYERGQHVYPVGSQGPTVQGSLKHHSDYRHPPDHFRGPDSFTEYDKGIHGNFSDGRFMPDSNFSGGGSDRVTLIKLKNLPFQASSNEILDFFHGYKIIPESLSIEQNEYGKSSGEAVIALVNYNEAVAAVNELNDRPIGRRKIRINLL